MSIQTEITRLQGLKNTLRTKLVSFGLVQSSADLEDCVTAVDAVENRGAAVGTISTVDGDYTIQAGYHNGSGKVSIAVPAKLKPQVADILINECGLPELVPAEYGGTADA